MLRYDTVDHVAGGFDDEFWGVDVLRAAKAYPAVWHASLALAAMHSRLVMMATAARSPASPSKAANDRYLEQRYYVFALGQYNSAIREVTKIMARNRYEDGGKAAVAAAAAADQETLLLVSVLFTGICTMQRDLQPALTHIKSALGMFYSWRFWERTANDHRQGVLPPRSITAVMTMFETHYSNLAASAHPQQSIRWADTAPRCSTVPFRTVKDAYFEYLPIQGWAQSKILLRGPPKRMASPAVVEDVQREFDVWAGKFAAFKRTLDPDEPVPHNSVVLLELLELSLRTFLGLASDDVKTIPKWRSSGPQFERLICWSERLTKEFSDLNDASKKALNIGYRFCPTLNEVLRFVAFFAFDFDVRRRAIALMRRCKRMDGLWYNDLSAQIAVAKLEVERSEALDWREACDCVRCVYVCEKHRPRTEEEELPREVTMMNMKELERDSGVQTVVDVLPWVPKSEESDG
ncbi:hypothetical protein K4F52_000960 [Lecanicillium sp. MT-2017a]|nr:hypothetical protein K4F52_000960 [Lecanicillium sp. MT-2017a]